MVEGKRVVVASAYQEELLVADTIRGIPAFVDAIVVVDDHSGDATVERARGTGDPRVDVIEHEENTGVGGAIVTGYTRCRELGIDVTCVMAADNQMDPDELGSLVAPVARGETDYAKANRLVSGEAWKLIPLLPVPRQRRPLVAHEDRLGATGTSPTPQAGYTALSLRGAPARLDLELPLSPLRLPERHARAPERAERRASATSRRGRSTGSVSWSGTGVR